MRKRKTIMIIAVFIVIIIGIGSFVLVRGIGKTPVSDEQKYESIKTPNAHTSAKIAATTGDKEKKSSKQMEQYATSPPLFVSQAPSANKNGPKTVTYTGDPSQQEKEEGSFNEEEYCMKLMHERGWYKPEDVTIIYGPPPENKNEEPPGVWIWKEVNKGEYAGTELPAHIKERNKEIDVKLQEAHAKGDDDEVSRLNKEFHELNRPYDDSVILMIGLREIPKSWHQYFNDIFMSEASAIK